MGTFWITTGTMLLRQFIEYCDTLKVQNGLENRDICKENSFNTFITVPTFNGICAMLWVRNLNLSKIVLHTSLSMYVFIVCCCHHTNTKSCEENDLQNYEIL